MKCINIHKQTHKETLLKFLFLVSILGSYCAYLSWKYDFATGGIVSVLTWCFFVLCTPIADAGFMLDFPIRLILGFRMIFTEVLVWIIAISTCYITIWLDPAIYQKTLLTAIFYKILTTPNPYWSIIALCCIGTFLSIYFGDEMLDVVSHSARKKYHHYVFKYRILLMIIIFTVIFIIYHHLILQMGLENLFK